MHSHQSVMINCSVLLIPEDDIEKGEQNLEAK